MSFDVDTYAASTSPVRTDDLDLASFRHSPLSAEALRCLRYMHDVESHTVCYLRDLLLTPSHRDPRVTTFLTAWAYEEHWHEVALGRVLAEHDEAAGAARVADLRSRLPRKDHLAPFLSALGGLLAGEERVGGAGVMPAEETRFLLDWLLAGDDGAAAARRIDANVARLPGLHDLRIVTDAVAA